MYIYLHFMRFTLYLCHFFILHSLLFRKTIPLQILLSKLIITKYFLCNIYIKVYNINILFSQYLNTKNQPYILYCKLVMIFKVSDSRGTSLFLLTTFRHCALDCGAQRHSAMFCHQRATTAPRNLLLKIDQNKNKLLTKYNFNL